MNEIKNINDLRDALADALKKVDSGEHSPSMANAISNLSGKILNAVKLEIEYNKIIGRTPSINFIKTLPKDALIKHELIEDKKDK